MTLGIDGQRRVLVCGGRDYGDEERVAAVLDAEHKREPITFIIQGGAKGADALALGWAKKHDIKVLTYHAAWRVHGVKAGGIRNQEMIDLGKPTDAIAFPGGSGTADMVRRLDRAKIPVQVVKHWFAAP